MTTASWVSRYLASMVTSLFPGLASTAPLGGEILTVYGSTSGCHGTGSSRAMRGVSPTDPPAGSSSGRVKVAITRFPSVRVSVGFRSTSSTVNPGSLIRRVSKDSVTMASETGSVPRL